MIIDALKKPMFGMIVSFMLGLAIVLVISPICHGAGCMIIKAPPINEVNKSIYHIASKCYKFDVTALECPAQGAIEAFENKS